MTGPYHIIGSLYFILKDFKRYRLSIITNKKQFLKKFGNLSPYSKKTSHCFARM